jgi:hypothetical protein
MQSVGIKRDRAVSVLKGQFWVIAESPLPTTWAPQTGPTSEAAERTIHQFVCWLFDVVVLWKAGVIVSLKPVRADRNVISLEAALPKPR